MFPVATSRRATATWGASACSWARRRGGGGRGPRGAGAARGQGPRRPEHEDRVRGEGEAPDAAHPRRGGDGDRGPPGPGREGCHPRASPLHRRTEPDHGRRELQASEPARPRMELGSLGEERVLLALLVHGPLSAFSDVRKSLSISSASLRPGRGWTRMADVKWNFEAEFIQSCNCDYGCPCNFNGYPTHGNCHALNAYRP